MFIENHHIVYMNIYIYIWIVMYIHICIAHTHISPKTAVIAVQSAQMSGTYCVYTRNRNSDLGNVLCMWKLEP